MRKRLPILLPGAPRRGAILIVALIALAVTSAIGAGLLRRASLLRQEMQRRERMIQAEWLTDSGLSRGLAKLRADPKYDQETWIVPAEDLGERDPGRVAISVTRDESSPGRFTLSAVADFPDRPFDRARSRRTIVVTLPPAE